MHLGDILGEYSESHFYWMGRELYASLNGIPFFTIPGNHDVFLKTKVNKEQYKEVFGPTYYWFGYGDVLFIAYDSSEVSISDEQIQWLSDTLNKIRPLFKYCIIYSHVPPVNPPDRPKYKLDDTSILKLEKVLAKHKIDLLMFGHVHYFSETSFAGIPVYTLPPSGQRPRSKKEGYGYVSVTINKNGVDEVKHHFIDIGNANRKEKITIFIIDNVLTTKTCYTSAYLLIFGLGLSLFSRKKLNNYKKHKKTN